MSINPDVSAQVYSSEFQPLTIFLGQLQGFEWDFPSDSDTDDTDDEL